MKGTKQLKLDPTIYDALIKEKVGSFYLFAVIFTMIEIYLLCWYIHLLCIISLQSILSLLILLINGVCVKLLYAKFSMTLFIYYCHLAKCSSIKRNTILVDWFCMCKASGKLVEYLRLYCFIARDLWSSTFSLFWVGDTFKGYWFVPYVWRAKRINMECYSTYNMGDL